MQACGAKGIKAMCAPLPTCVSSHFFPLCLHISSSHPLSPWKISSSRFVPSHLSPLLFLSSCCCYINGSFIPLLCAILIPYFTVNSSSGAFYFFNVGVPSFIFRFGLLVISCYPPPASIRRSS